MARKANVVAAQPGVPELQVTSAVALCAGAYYVYSLSRYLAARTAEMIFDGISRLTTSPLEMALLAMLALWFVSWSLDRHARAAQLLSTLPLRQLGAVLLQAQQQALSAALTAAGSKARGGKRRAPPASPGKDIASFRLPENAYGRGRRRGAATAAAAATSLQQQKQQQPQQRWSMDGPASGAGGDGSSQQQQRRRQQIRIQPKPRTSVDFEVAPSPPPRRTQQHGASRRTVADHNAAPQLGDSSDGGGGSGAESSGGSRQQQRRRRQDKFQPRMQRIASGQQLADLAAGRSSLDGGAGGAQHSAGSSGSSTPRGAPTAAAPSAAPCSLAAAVSASTAASAAPAALASWLPTNYIPWLSPFAGASAAGDFAAAGPAAADSSGGLDTAASAAALGQWVASTGSAAAAWASSTVDTVLRPLIPGTRPLEALLWRSPSTPVPAQPQQQSGAVGSAGQQRSAPAAMQRAGHAASLPLPNIEVPSPATAADRRRQSMDGQSARHYTHGGVTADPNRKQALEHLACAARLQSCGASHSLLAGAGGSSSSSSHLPGHIAVSATAAGCGPGCATSLGADAGASALASIGLDGDCPQEIRDHITDEHLLQFAAVAGEEAARAAARELALPAAWAAPGSLLGPCDASAACSDERWERVIERSEGGLSYEVWRQELRGGLYMYRSRALFAGVSPKDLRPFHLDDHARHLWDENVVEIRRVRPQGQSSPRLHRHSEWCLHQYRTRFPRPMAAREYQYARRVWHRPSDGGAYVLCRGLPMADAGDGYRSVKVTDFVSGCAIRAAPGGAEVVALYFEDSGVRAGLAKMAVKGMWGYMQTYEAALRVFAEARQQAAVAGHLAPVGAAGTPLRRSLEAGQTPAAAHGQAKTPQRTRRRLLALAPEPKQQADDDTASSSGDDAMHSSYAALARRLRRGADSTSGVSSKSRWGGRLVVLAGIRMVHVMLAASSRR